MSACAADLFRRIDAFEHGWCLKMNRGCGRPYVRELFVIVSRLGDGIFWYALVLATLIVDRENAALPAVRTALAGLTGVLLYKYLKSRLVRERPYISLVGIVPGTRALDRYSFPSGHTLHAVNFTILLTAAYPGLGAICIPFAILVAASRVVLGLHYPSDVLAGAILGTFLAMSALALMPLG